MNKPSILGKVAMQLALNIAVPLMRAQGCRSMRAGGGPMPACYYRGPEGNKCFIGHLIADEFYHTSMEDRDASDDRVVEALQKSGIYIPRVDRKLFVFMQRRLHDQLAGEDFHAEFEASLALVCRDWDLTVPPQETAG